MNNIQESFEGHGQGFGQVSAETAQELVKALQAGYAVTPGTKTGGGALRVEALDATLKIVSFMMKNIVFWNDISKTEATNTVEEFNRLSKFGGRGGFFIDEGALPRTEDSNYSRNVAFVKFMGSTREITHPMLMVKPAHGNVVALETKNGVMWILQRLEEALFSGNSANISQSFDGLEKQLLDGYADASAAGDGAPAVSSVHVIDLRGKPLTESAFETGSETIINNYGYPTDCYMSYQSHSDFNKLFFSAKRYNLPAPGDGIVGFNTNKIQLSGGLVNLKSDVFIRPNLSAPAAADNSSAPTAPTSATVTVQAKTTSRGFADATEYGSYVYAVSAVSKSGESAVTAGSATAVITSGNNEAKIVIVKGAVSGNDDTQAFRVYRSCLEDGVSGTKYLVAEIPCAGASTNYLDGNEQLPGLPKAYMGQLDESVLTYRQLAPMLKFPLATLASSIRWMQLQYGTPIVFQPRKWVIYKNIGRVGVPSVA